MCAHTLTHHSHIHTRSTRPQVIKLYENKAVKIPDFPPPGCCPKLYEVIRAMLNPDPAERMTVGAAFMKLTDLVPLAEAPGDLFINAPRYGLAPATRDARERQVELIYETLAMNKVGSGCDRRMEKIFVETLCSPPHLLTTGSCVARSCGRNP